MELTLLDYHMVHYRPSEVAAASLLLAQLVLEGLAWVSLADAAPPPDPPPECGGAQPGLLSSDSGAAALLHLQRGPPEAHRAAHRQKRADGDGGEEQVHGECGAGAEGAGGRLTGSSSSSSGCEEQVLAQPAAEDQPPPSAERRRPQEHGRPSAGPSGLLTRLRSRAAFFWSTTDPLEFYFCSYFK